MSEHRTGGVGPARDVSYTYDADSNRSSEIDLIDPAKSRFYEYYPESQRLHYLKDGSSPTAHILEEYEWTANGEQKRKKLFDPATGQEKSHEDYTWGIDGTLKQVVFTGGDNDGYKLEYDYDHEGTLVGRREYKKNGAGAYVIQKHAKYLVDSENLTGYSQILAEIDGLTGKVKTYNILTDQLAAQSDLDPQGKPTTKLLQTDALGSIRAVSQKTIDQPASHSPLDYTAFGSLLAVDRSLTSYGFTGQLVESMTGQQYHRARWYLPKIGTFPTIDSYNYQIDEIRLSSSYGYASINPVNYVDPSGLIPLSIDMGNIIHWDMQTRYKGLHPGEDVRLERTIIFSYKSHRPDIINVTRSEIYEIKPLSSYGKRTGKPQLGKYVLILNATKYGNKTNYHPGLSYVPDVGTVYPVLGYPGYSYTQLGNYSGVLYYKVFNNPRVPLPIPLPLKVQEKVERDVRELTPQLIYEPVLLNQLLDIKWDVATIVDATIGLVAAGVALGTLRMQMMIENALIIEMYV